ncbi:hypothetical protein IJG72_04405 [bacterium]|nr:hypothetical protein [bacterium]
MRNVEKYASTSNCKNVNMQGENQKQVYATMPIAGVQPNITISGCYPASYYITTYARPEIMHLKQAALSSQMNKINEINAKENLGGFSRDDTDEKKSDSNNKKLKSSSVSSNNNVVKTESKEKKEKGETDETGKLKEIKEKNEKDVSDNKSDEKKLQSDRIEHSVVEIKTNDESKQKNEKVTPGLEVKPKSKNNQNEYSLTQKETEKTHNYSDKIPRSNQNEADVGYSDDKFLSNSDKKIISQAVNNSENNKSDLINNVKNNINIAPEQLYKLIEKMGKNNGNTENSKVELTDEYIMRLENRLNKRNERIRLDAAKEVMERLEEDSSRRNHPALIALFNKMLQDPSENVRIYPLSALSQDILDGDAYTQKIIKAMIKNDTKDSGEAKIIYDLKYT